MTYLVHLCYEMAAHSTTIEEGDCLDYKPSPLLGISEQLHIFSKRIVSGYGIQSIDNLGVFRLQLLCLLHVVVSGVQGEDIHIQTSDTRYMSVLNESSISV